MWACEADGWMQEKIANLMGWSRSPVSNDARVQAIDTQAWQEMATTLAPMDDNSDDEDVGDTATIVTSPFTESLLCYLVPGADHQALGLTIPGGPWVTERHGVPGGDVVAGRAARYRSRPRWPAYPHRGLSVPQWPP